jgi:hypothetical protein
MLVLSLFMDSGQLGVKRGHCYKALRDRIDGWQGLAITAGFWVLFWLVFTDHPDQAVPMAVIAATITVGLPTIGRWIGKDFRLRQ